MNTSKLRIGVEETKTVRPCCRGLIIAHSELALGKQQMTEILTMEIIIKLQTLVIRVD